MVYSYMTYTERAPRRKQFYVAPAIHQPNSTVRSLHHFVNNDDDDDDDNNNL